MGKDIHVVSMDVEAIAVIKKNRKIIIRRDVSGSGKIVVILAV